MAHLKKKQPSKKNDKLLWHTKTAVSDVKQPTRHHKHVCVSTQADGRLDLSTSYLATTSSEPVDASFDPITEPKLQDGISDEDRLDEPEFLDPGYIQHLAEISLDPKLNGKRQRLPGVSTDMQYYSLTTEGECTGRSTTHVATACRHLFGRND
jgi:hypothetical protein